MCLIALCGCIAIASAFSPSLSMPPRAFSLHKPCSAASSPHRAALCPPTRRAALRMSTLENVDTSVEEAIKGPKFDFKKQWYPLAVPAFIDPKKPQAAQLLGHDLVIWRDTVEGKWHVFEDACPHRLAPLSEGRVEEDGTLLCAYHAWRFDSSGKCTSMPHAMEGTEKKLTSAPPSCAVSYPTQEAQGLLWVWGSPGAPGSDAALEAALKEPSVIPELDDPALEGRVNQYHWNIRDMPYGWDYFTENVLDPAHVAVSHHGLVGSRYDGQPISYEQTRALTTEGGFALGIKVGSEEKVAEQDKKGLMPEMEFVPPARVIQRNRFPHGGQMILALYSAPTKPGWVRHIGCNIIVKGEDGKVPDGLAFFSIRMPVWLSHITAALFLHMDMVFLHHQEKILASKGYKNEKGGKGDYLSLVHVPTQQDLGVNMFRKWLQNSCDGGVPWPEGCEELPPRERNNDKLFDVYDTHTANCAICKTALKNFKTARFVLFAAAFAVAAFFKGVTALVGGGLLAIAGLLLGKIINMFYHYPFDHAYND